MSKPQTDEDLIRIQFKVEKGDLYFDTIQVILKKFPNKIKSNSIREALKDFVYLLEYTKQDKSLGIIKLIDELRNGKN